MKELLNYQDMTVLMKGAEWREWVKFLRERIEGLKTKVVDKVREGRLQEAQNLVAVIDDIKMQVELFTVRRKDLEDELENPKEE